MDAFAPAASAPPASPVPLVAVPTAPAAPVAPVAPVPAPVAALVVIRLLTDNTKLANEHGGLPDWEGKANPVPPGVNKHYWYKLYNRADSHVRCHVKANLDEYIGPTREDGGYQKELVEGTKWFRREGRTYKVAVLLLVRDLVATAEFDFRFFGGGQREQKAQALRRTREMLPPAFFQWFEDYTRVKFKVAGGMKMLRRRRDVAPEELGLEPPMWFGTGDWVTTLRLEDDDKNENFSQY